jgi:hypothetical protein
MPTIPKEPGEVKAEMPAEDKVLFLAQLKLAYDDWIDHYSGNCTGCKLCDGGGPTERKLLPYFKKSKATAAADWIDALKWK